MTDRGALGRETQEGACAETTSACGKGEGSCGRDDRRRV